MFSLIVRSLDTLGTTYLTQENLNSLLENPMQSGNIASALTVLDSNYLLTVSNRIKLLDAKNQFLISDEAFNLVWLPLDRYLSTLDNLLHEKQWVFDQLVTRAQQQNPAEKIQNYMQELTSGSSQSRKHNDTKYNTAPPANRRNSQDNLDQCSQLTRQPTL